MKNIHTLSTDKPSRVFIDIDDNKLKITIPIGGEHMMNQHIFITSDEEIKEGDWLIIIDDFETYVREHKGDNLPTTYHKKIILTTDQDLIKDGVQAIDDDFLEWFVQNPSCEWVEVKKGKMKLNDDGEEYGFPDMSLYKIIIPKEELKQETLEEAAEKYANDWEEIHPELDSEDMTPIEVSKIDFIVGAKWQQERMYSEEDLEVAFFEGQFGKYSFNDWLEQFKKK